MGETLFGIAGPVSDPPEDAATADYAIWRLGSSGEPDFWLLADKDARIKPEALVPLGGDASHLSALLLYDGPEGGMPKEIMLEINARAPAPACGAQRRRLEP